MIVVVEAHNAHEHAGLLEDMFRMRARIFHARMGWDVRLHDDLERDRYDDEAPVYLINVGQSGQVIASCRLLPTTGPTMLAEVFSDTLPDAAKLSSPSIWECTRFCVDYQAAGPDELQRTLRAGGALVASMGRIGLEAGITTFLGNFDAMMLRVYRRIGCEVEVLGCTHRFGKPIYLGAFPVAQSIIDTVTKRIALPEDLSFGPVAA